MKKLALAIAAAALLGIAAPSLVSSASAAPVVTQDSTDVSAARVVKKKVIVRRGRPHRMGRHDMGRHMGAVKKRTVIKHRGGKTVKKTVIRR